jgi:flagellin
MSIFNALITPIGESLASQEIILHQLSSFNRLTPTFLDPGSLGVASTLQSSVTRSTIVANNLATTNSFLQTQDAALETASNVLDRIGQLKAMSEGVFGDPSGVYQAEYEVLSQQLSDLSSSTFNSVDLFASGGGSLSVIGDINALNVYSINQSDIEDAVTDVTSQANITDLSSDNIDDAIQNISNLRATNGAQQSQVLASFDMLKINTETLSNAYSIIVDVSFAQTLTNYALAGLQTSLGILSFAKAQTSATAVNSLLLR